MHRQQLTWRACHSTGTTTRRRRRHGDDGRRLREAGEHRDVHALLRDLQLAANVQVLPLVLRAVHRQAQARQDKQVAAARLQVPALPQVVTSACAFLASYLFTSILAK